MEASREARSPAQVVRLTAREQMLKAARECFLSKGVGKTTMDDVARAAGEKRQLVYRLFLDRRELVEAAINARVAEIADEIAADDQADPDADFAEVFTRVSVTVIERMRSDHELGVLVGRGSPVSLHEALWNDVLADRGGRFWEPLLEQARREGRLREDLSRDAFSDWLKTVYVAMILRPNLNPDAERELIERFVLTSLVMATRPETGRP